MIRTSILPMSFALFAANIQAAKAQVIYVNDEISIASSESLGPAIWKEFHVGMSIDEAVSALSRMPTIKKFKIDHSNNTRMNMNDPLLPTGLQFPIDITNFTDDSKLTSILGVPVVFDLGFDSNEKLSVIIIHPVLKISGNYKTTGLGCAGILPHDLQEFQIFWETAISTKYKNRNQISEESTSFTDGKINVSIDYKKKFRNQETDR